MKIAVSTSGLRERPMPPESWSRLGEVVKQQIVGLERMAADLLDLALLESGQLRLKLHREDLCKIARQTVELFRPTAPVHVLELHAPPEPVWIECDATRIQQVLANLITNAIKYSPKGGRVDVTIERHGAEEMFSVSDCGLGISLEDQHRLFEPFCRIDTADGLIPGVGLGLATARMLIQAHGGRIEVISQLSVGTTFRVFLPIGATNELDKL
jgi:signal transduction histidine kinase